MIGVLGGVCSECDESADCKPEPGFGCNAGNPLSMFPAVCSTTGDLGEGCETAEDCAGTLRCVTIIDVPGIVTASTCSECDPQQDCGGGLICAPLYAITDIAGHYRCVEPGTVPNGDGCNPLAGGAECVSGQCVSASLMGIPVVNVCSTCDEDADCQAGEICQLPEVVVDGDTLVLVPGACV
jgi:hypothetical protein